MSTETPDGWTSTTVGEIAAVNMGQSPPSSTVTDDGEGLPFIQGNAEFGAHFPTPRQFAASCPKIVETGDILLSVRAPVGEVNVAPERLCIGRGLAGLRPTAVDPDFLFYAISGLAPMFARLSQGSTFDAINGKDLRAIPLNVPLLHEQRRIAEVLRSVDETIAANESLLNGIRSAKQGAMEAVLSRGFSEVRLETLLAETRYPMRSGPFGSALLKSELHQEGIPFLGIDNVHVERFVPVYRRFVSEEKYRELSRYTVYPGDVMVTIMGTVGRCCIVPPDVGIAISSKHVWTLTIDQTRYSPALLAWQINHSPPVLQQLQGSAQGGIMSAISSGTLRGLMVPLPSPTEVREIEDLLLSFNAQIAALEAEQDQANTLKTSLMSDLLSGRVRIPA